MMRCFYLWLTLAATCYSKGTPPAAYMHQMRVRDAHHQYQQQQLEPAQVIPGIESSSLLIANLQNPSGSTSMNDHTHRWLEQQTSGGVEDFQGSPWSLPHILKGQAERGPAGVIVPAMTSEQKAYQRLHGVHVIPNAVPPNRHVVHEAEWTDLKDFKAKKWNNFVRIHAQAFKSYQNEKTWPRKFTDGSYDFVMKTEKDGSLYDVRMRKTDVSNHAEMLSDSDLGDRIRFMGTMQIKNGKVVEWDDRHDSSMFRMKSGVDGIGDRNIVSYNLALNPSMYRGGSEKSKQDSVPTTMTTFLAALQMLMVVCVIGACSCGLVGCATGTAIAYHIKIKDSSACLM